MIILSHRKRNFENVQIYFSLNISGVALLLNGLRSLRHVVYDVMSDVLTYIDFNTSDLILPKLELRYILFTYPTHSIITRSYLQTALEYEQYTRTEFSEKTSLKLKKLTSKMG